MESLSPHRVLGVDENDARLDPLKADGAEAAAEQTFTRTIQLPVAQASVVFWVESDLRCCAVRAGRVPT